MLKYKEFVGSVSYSDADKCFFGKIENIPDLVNYESKSIGGLQKAFEDSIECYIESSVRHGKKITVNSNPDRGS